MGLEDLKSFILEIENDFPVDEWCVNGVCLWPCLRTYFLKDRSIFYYTKTSSIQTNAINTSTDLLNEKKVGIVVRLKESLKYRFAKLQRAKRYRRLEKKIIGSKADVLFQSFANYNVSLESNVFNRFITPLIPVVNNSNVKHLFFELRLNGDPVNFRAKESIPLEFMLEYFVSTRASMLEQGALKISLPQHDIFFKRLQQRFPTANLSDYSVESIVARFSYILIYKEFYCKYLSKLALKAVFQVCYYSPQGFALNLACKELSIPSIDIQHGLISPNNFVYSEWNVPEGGYDALPNYFFTWGNKETQIVNSWARMSKGGHCAITFGNVWLQYFKSNKGLFKDDAIDALVQKFRHINNPKFILFASSPIASEFDILPALKEMIAASPQNYVWLFRKHQRSSMPNEMIEDYLVKATGNQNIEVDLSSNVVIPLLFSLADIHLTGWSSTTLDASYFGTHTLLITKKGTLHFLKELEEGLVSFVGETPKEMLTFLDDYFATDHKAADSLADNVQYSKVLTEFLCSKNSR